MWVFKGGEEKEREEKKKKKKKKKDLQKMPKIPEIKPAFDGAKLIALIPKAAMKLFQATKQSS
jgi:hypothetical protein